MTLAYLANPCYAASSPLAPSLGAAPTPADRLFYKRRICALNKRLLKSGPRDSTGADLKAAHAAFVAAAVRHFKMVDTHDHVQETIGDRETVTDPVTPAGPVQQTTTDADALLHAAPKRVTLDGFVKRTSSAKPRRVVPRVSLNLGDESLRSKGLKKRPGKEKV